MIHPQAVIKKRRLVQLLQALPEDTKQFMTIEEIRHKTGFALSTTGFYVDDLAQENMVRVEKNFPTDRKRVFITPLGIKTTRAALALDGVTPAKLSGNKGGKAFSKGVATMPLPMQPDNKFDVYVRDLARAVAAQKDIQSIQIDIRANEVTIVRRVQETIRL